MTKVLITGISGFVGNHLRQLLEEKEFEVEEAVRPIYKEGWSSHIPIAKTKNL